MKLTKKEKEVLNLLATGLSCKEMESKLKVTESSIQSRLLKARARNNCKTTYQLIIKADRLKMLNYPFVVG